jgi:uncharacterized protein
MTRRILLALSMFVLCAFAANDAFFAKATAASYEGVKVITVRGRLKKTVEPGGWVLIAGQQKYLLLNSQKFASESWFAEGNELEATGEVKTGVMTTYMEGTPFEAHSLRPFEQSGSETSGAASRGLTRVLVTGDFVVQAQPDTAILVISVVTQDKGALGAQQENANRSTAVVRALKTAAGAGAEIKTSGYSIQPQRVYKENQPPTIIGYEARNTVSVILSDLTKVGEVIDAAAQAGANDVGSISFTLRKDRPARDQALSEATKVAISKAQVIAQALGGKFVRVVEVQEEGYLRPRPIQAEFDMARTMKAAGTPIEVGSLDISVRLQLVAEIQTDGSNR